MAKSNQAPRRPNRTIYLDYASSALKTSPNPSAIHDLGVKERVALEALRARAARVLGAHPNEIIFTSGATESNNLAILGVMQAKQNRPASHIVTTNIEHASVLEAVKHLGNATLVPVEPDGVVDAQKIKNALKRDTILVSVMYANNEIGTIQPIREIAKVIRHHNKTNGKKVIFHTDAVQAANYLPIKVDELGVDMLTLNAAKIYGPKGVGLLYVRRGTPLAPIMFGGEQERGLRPGTENILGIKAFVLALETAEKAKNKETARLTKLRNQFIAKLRENFLFRAGDDAKQDIPRKGKSPEVYLNGDLEKRLPNNINITIPKIPSELLVIELSARGIMVSNKSACKAGDGKASHVIKAINPNAQDVDGSLRLSLGRDTTKKDLDATIIALKDILKKLEKWYT